MRQRQPKAEKQFDKDVETAYYKHGQGVQINIMDIPKVFSDAKVAVAAGLTIEESVVASIARLRRN